MSSESQATPATTTAAPHFNFALTLEEINHVLLSLAERPFKEVAGLVGKIHFQHMQQTQPQAELNVTANAAATQSSNNADVTAIQ